MTRTVNDIAAFTGTTAPLESFTPAPEKVLDGACGQSVQNVYSDASGRFHCGIWTGEAGCWTVSYDEDEFCHLLEGEVELSDGEGGSRRFGPGDAFVVPAGFAGTWRNLSAAKKLYVILEPAA